MKEMVREAVANTSRLIPLIADALGVDPATITDESSPATVKEWDSLNHLCLVIALESEFKLRLSPEDVLAMHNVAAIRRIVDGYPVETSDRITLMDCDRRQLAPLKEFLVKSYGPGYILTVHDALFHWQFTGVVPQEGRAYQLRLAILQERIVGCLGYIPVAVNVGQRVFRGVWLLNWMVDPDYRDAGLGPLLVNDVCGEFEVSLALGIGSGARDMFRRMGWTDLGLLPRYVRVLQRDAAQRLVEGGELNWPPAPAPSKTGEARGVELGAVRRFDETAMQLWDRLLTEDPFLAGTRRTAAFLNWRYADHPEFTYRMIEARRQGELLGLAVYRAEEARGVPVRVGRIVELLAVPEVVSPLLEMVLNDLHRQQVAVVDFFCGSQRLAAVFKEHGFLPGSHEAARRFPLVYQPIDRRRVGIALMADLQRTGLDAIAYDWHVTKSDGDQDRPN